MKILIDNGHGENTPGKRSPDGTFREYAYTREIADEVVRELAKRGYGANNVLLVSIHCNAAGNGEWMNARGWSAYTTKGKTKADELANRMYDAAACFITGQKIRRDYSDGDPDWEENFYILSKTKCPAVLTENFFMDNKEDIAYLTSMEGKQNIVNTHVEGIIQYIKEYEK